MAVPKRIFIVEDNEIYSMILDYILTKDSMHRFISFKSGEECIKNLYLDPDIIILDYGLPGKNGYDTLLEIKKYNPRIHVVMLSSNTNKELATKLMNAGADDYVLKQGRGETQIINKIDTILNLDRLEKNTYLGIRTKSTMERMMYFILIIIIASSLGYYWFA